MNYDPIPANRFEVSRVMLPENVKNYTSDFIGKVLPVGTYADYNPDAESRRFGAKSRTYDLSGKFLKNYIRGDAYSHGIVIIE